MLLRQIDGLGGTQGGRWGPPIYRTYFDTLTVEYAIYMYMYICVYIYTLRAFWNIPTLYRIAKSISSGQASVS